MASSLIVVVGVLMPLLQGSAPGSAEVGMATSDYVPYDLGGVFDQLGVAVGDLRIRSADLDLFDRQGPRSPLLDWALASPLKMMGLVGVCDGAFRVGDVSDLAAKAIPTLSRWQGRTVRRGLVGDPLSRARSLSGGDGALLKAIERVYQLGGKPLDDAKRKDIEAKLEGAPEEFAGKLAVLIQTMCDAQQWCDLACESYSAQEWSRILGRELRGGNGKTPFDDYRGLQLSAQAIRGFDTALVVGAAEEVVFAAADVSTLFAPPPEEQELVPGPMPIVGRTNPNLGAQTAPGDMGQQPKERGKGKNREKNKGSENASAPPPPPVFAMATPKWTFVLQTPLGLISIGSEHRLEGLSMPPFLVIDYEGDDNYTTPVGANAAPRQRVSVLLDFGGNDSYTDTKTETGTMGAGNAGIGLLFDFAGNDIYTVQRNGLGQALFGVGLVYDASGTDQYEAVERAEGCATAGVAMLVDVRGSDRYLIYSAGQAFGGPGGVAALIDQQGDDVYIANDSDIRYPSPQSPKHNTSLAQGAASGWRGDYLQGLSMPGGVGILYDGAGKDSYTCGVFGQGVGYWFGTGILYDRAGDDTYRGQWYAQGASAHFAVGALLDGGGNDSYTATMNVTQGAGHDVGLGMLVDFSGDDRYQAGGLSLGAGNAAAVGFFLDGGGNDRYGLAAGKTNNLGYVAPNASTTIRKTIGGAGVFIDLGGKDQYPSGRGGDGRMWTGPIPSAPDVAPGIARGLDIGGASRK